MSNQTNRPIFTHAPRQHRNLILGSFHLLWWMLFHPRAFHNHLSNLDPQLEVNSSLLFFLDRSRWHKVKNLKFLLQSLIILPIFGTLSIGIVNFIAGIPFSSIQLSVFISITVSTIGSILFCYLYGITYGIAIGLALSTSTAITVNTFINNAELSIAKIVVLCLSVGIIFGITIGMVAGITFDRALEISKGITFSLAVGVLTGTVFCVSYGFRYGSRVALEYGFIAGLSFSMAGGLGAFIHHWLPYLLYPLLQVWNLFLFVLEHLLGRRRRLFLRWHSVGWYEWGNLPLLILDEHLLLAITINNKLGLEAITFLINSDRDNQKKAASEAQIKFHARQLSSCKTIEDIKNIPIDWQKSYLPDPTFSIFGFIIENVYAIKEQKNPYNQIQTLNTILLSIEEKLQQLNGSRDRHIAKILPVLEQWRGIVAAEIEKLSSTQEIDSPYIIAVPLTPDQKIFTGREDLGIRLEQLIRDIRRPPLLLYGQRRMGKTSILRNLEPLLPSRTIIPLFIDLQGHAASAQNLSGFFYAIAKDIRTALPRDIWLPPVALSNFAQEPTIQFNNWLDKLETKLGDKIALIAFDEFEALDSSFKKGRLNEDDVLSFLRRLIQHRSKLKVLIAGSHSMEEYQRWSSYLINVQTLYVSYLKDSEAKHLITQPLPDFPLRYTDTALELVLNLTRCHPFLIQLLCHEIIMLKNEQKPAFRHLATPEDVENAVSPSLDSSSMGFFSDLEKNQVDDLGRQMLIYLARLGEGGCMSRAELQQKFDVDITASFDRLIQREIIELASDKYRFQVELIRRWFARNNL